MHGMHGMKSMRDAIEKRQIPSVNSLLSVF